MDSGQVHFNEYYLRRLQITCYYGYSSRNRRSFPTEMLDEAVSHMETFIDQNDDKDNRDI